uniref:phytanoyl-CoA dioxygenase family protein n=1 Tax=Pedobacter schmidteae TaxID=2201271 RepID=UPI000EADD7F6|nr:phytanoyl-CoA dioxygenase family protein [Pedobacter schmidteae]
MQAPELSVVNRFFSAYRNHHSPHQRSKEVDEDFKKKEQAFLNIFQIGLFEIYEFLYQHCKDDAHFEAWLIELKGKTIYDEALFQFNRYREDGRQFNPQKFNSILSQEQQLFWEQNGYLKIDQVIDGQRCDAIIRCITDELQVDLTAPESWYRTHSKLQGMMLQLYQGEVFDAIRQDLHIRDIFASLYGHQNIMPNCDKVSFNPPVNDRYTFKGSPLHWDIDFNIGPRYYIQGLVYLNDTPVNRGPLTLVPGYHHQLANVLKEFHDPELAINSLREKKQEIAIAGQQGDLVLWLESLPHAASPNRSELPRFVQYVSFSELPVGD